MSKDKTFIFRASEQEIKTLRDKAKELGLSASAYILKLCIYNNQDVYTNPAKDVYTKQESTPKKEKPAPKIKPWSGGYGKDKAIK